MRRTAQASRASCLWRTTEPHPQASRVGLPAAVVKAAVELLEKNKRVLAGKNPWVSAAAALWLASFKMLGLLKTLAEAAGTTTASIRNAAKRMRV